MKTLFISAALLILTAAIQCPAFNGRQELERDQYKAVLDALISQFKIRDDQSIGAIKKTPGGAFAIDLIDLNGTCRSTMARITDSDLNVDFPRLPPTPCK